MKAATSTLWFLLRIFLIAVGLLIGVFFPALTSAAEIPEVPGFHVAATQPGAWPDILHSFGLQEQTADNARVIVLPYESDAFPVDWLAHVQTGRILILEGDSPTARTLGIRATSRRVHVRKVRDIHWPTLPIVWEKSDRCPGVQGSRRSKSPRSGPHSPSAPDGGFTTRFRQRALDRRSTRNAGLRAFSLPFACSVRDWAAPAV